MENKKKKLLTSTLIAGAVIGSASVLNASSTDNLFSFNDLGSGSEIRTTLATQSISNDAGVYNLELKCGEDTKKAKTDKTAKKADSKSKDAKCGEGKCGDDKKAEKKTNDKKSSEAKADSKSKDAKCGEGKCGN